MILSRGFVITILAEIALLVGVSTFMSRESALLNGCIITILTGIRLVISMSALVDNEVVLSAG